MSTMTKRRKTRTGGAETEGQEKHRGRLERLLFSFMGPPQVGDPNTPVREPKRVDRCPRCGQSWDEHEVVRRASHSYTRCPIPPA